MTLTFNLFVILIGHSRRFRCLWSDVSMMNGLKVVRVFIEVEEVSGAITVKKGQQILSV